MFHKARYAYFCSFCGKSQDQTNRLIAGPGGVYVCGECIATFVGMERSPSGDQRKQACSFCGKKQNQVQFLVEGPRNVHICGECIDLCQEIITEQQSIVDNDAKKEI